MHGGNINNPPPVALAHARQRQSAGVEDAGQIYRQNIVPLFHRELLHRRHMLDTGVINHNIDAAKFAFGIAHHRFNLPDVAQVGIVIAGNFTQRGHLGSRARAVAKTIQHQLRAGLRQHFGNA